METFVLALEKESKTPPITEAQAKCAVGVIAEKYTPGEVRVLSPAAASSLKQEAKSACHIS